jgi:hypothetical protein
LKKCGELGAGKPDHGKIFDMGDQPLLKTLLVLRI